MTLWWLFSVNHSKNIRYLFYAEKTSTGCIRLYNVLKIQQFKTVLHVVLMLENPLVFDPNINLMRGCKLKTI